MPGEWQAVVANDAADRVVEAGAAAVPRDFVRVAESWKIVCAHEMMTSAESSSDGSAHATGLSTPPGTATVSRLFPAVSATRRREIVVASRGSRSATPFTSSVTDAR